MTDEIKKTIIEEPPIENPEDEIYYTELPVGELLQKTREKYNKTIPEISATLRIRSSLVEAIEQGDVDKLPGRVYAIGFVRAYAEYLSLDANKVVELFKVQHVGRRERPDYIFPVSAHESRVPSILIIGICLIMVIGTVIYQSSSNIPQEQAKPKDEVAEKLVVKSSIPEVPKELIKSIVLPEKLKPKKSTPAPEAINTKDEQDHKDNDIENPDFLDDEVAVGTISPHDNLNRVPRIRPIESLNPADTSTVISVNNDSEISDFSGRLRITSLDNSWMEITDQNGKQLFSKVLQKGGTYTVPDKKGLILSTSNAGGLEIRLGDRVLPSLGKRSQIRRDINLDDLKH